MKDIDLHVGHDPATTKARVLEAIRRTPAGQAVGESHVTFESWEGLARRPERQAPRAAAPRSRATGSQRRRARPRRGARLQARP
ncbi:MAG: hypothetical protein WDO24_13030 [Pseudomonadota bacterium]